MEVVFGESCIVGAGSKGCKLTGPEEPELVVDVVHPYNGFLAERQGNFRSGFSVRGVDRGRPGSSCRNGKGKAPGGDPHHG